MSEKEFLDNLGDDILNEVLESYAEELHGKAASVVDPETGKHAPVFVRVIGQEALTIHTTGSPAFARAVEKRLGWDQGEVHLMNEPADRERLVYLAHASEDKAIAKPLAEGLVQRGIDVWYDNWEIGPGDSLRRKMEEGLGDCTHFVVLLTARSMKKPWVQEEIDAGLMRTVEGSAKFIGLRHELDLSSLSPFLRTRLTPELKLGNDGLEELAGHIYGVSKKPPLGEAPRYIQQHEPGSSWSSSARIVAEYFVRASPHAKPMEPQVEYEEIQQETGLPMPDVRIGVLDLENAGLVEKREYVGGDGVIWPKSDLFMTFDGEFKEWDPEADARDLAVHLFNLEEDYADANEVGTSLGWEPRRFNSAAAYLVGAKIVESREYYGSDNDYWPCGFMIGDELLRFVRSI
ncbi:hypothetical protein FHS78_002649 [Parvibaculum indicum]|uniref:TIR domain-containing protein n=1 Tax=Parvibaculum indicum TaxID=562969 RepID=UPI001422095E|nr:hypothetical protein [Parvibaculum indicum]